LIIFVSIIAEEKVAILVAIVSIAAIAADEVLLIARTRCFGLVAKRLRWKSGSSSSWRRLLARILEGTLLGRDALLAVTDG